MTSALMAFLHHLTAFTLVDARRIQRMGLLYGISAAFILIVGLLRVFYFEKGAPYYAQN